MDVGKALHQLDQRLKALERSPRLSHASIENTAVQVYDGAGSLRGILGQQADGTTAANIVNGPPPPQPSAPLVASVLGGVAVSWDGLFADGSTLPLDWARVEVHASILASYTPVPATLQGTIETAQGATVVVPCDTPVYVRLVARNTSGTASAASDTVGPFGPTPVVADDILDGIVTTVKLADDAVTQAKVAVNAIGSTELQAGAVLEEKLAANAVTTAKMADAAISTLKLADDAVTKAKVAVGAIGSDELALGIGNMVPDPSFEGAYTAAAIAGHTDWTQTAPGNNSATALHVDCTFGSTTWKNIEIARYPVLPGERHFLGIDFKTSATFNGSGVKMMFRYEDAAATVLGYGVADKVFTPGAGWDRATAQVQAPTGTKTAVLLVEASACSAGEAWFDNAEVSTLVVGGKVAAGSITATEIAALTIQAGNLAADSVTAGKVAADAVTARELAANSVTASEIAANAVTAAAIAAGAITTDKLTVTGGGNWLSDPSFEGAYSTSLVAGDANFSIDATGNGSAHSLKVNAVAGSATTRSLKITTVRILPGEQLFLAFDYLTSSDYTSTAAVKLYARWEDSSGAILGYGTAQASPPTLGGSTWNRPTATVTAPATTVQATIWCESYQASAGTVWFDNAAVRPVAAATQIQDGAITTPKIAALAIQAGNIAADAVAAGKIAADAVTAREIAASAVTAAEIAANTITTSKLAAGAVDATALAADAITGKTITGGTITGATLQTAASGQRIALNESANNKIRVYNSSGTAIAELSTVGLQVAGTNGAVLWLDPNNTFPNLRLTTADQTNSAVINISGTSALLGLNSGLFSSGSFTDWKWRTIMGVSSGNEYWVAERTRDGDTSTFLGGRIFMDASHVSIGYRSSADSTQDGLINFTAQTAAVTGNLTVSGIGQRTPKRRTSNATRTSTVTPTSDTQLTWSVDANAVYALEGVLFYSGPGDFLMGWTFPSGTAGTWNGFGNGTTVVSGTGGGGTQQDTTSSWGYTVRTETTDLVDNRTYGGISTTGFAVHVRGTVRVGSTAGTFALQWAQGTSNATATTLYTDSRLTLEKIG